MDVVGVGIRVLFGWRGGGGFSGVCRGLGRSFRVYVCVRLVLGRFLGSRVRFFFRRSFR